MISKTIKYAALSCLAAATLSACGGGTCAPNSITPPVGDLSLAINAPSQYPAGVAVTAYLTMTNTSNVDGNNLVYTVPSDTNYTGVIITPYPKGAGEDCTNIAAGQSCTFTADIPAGSKPGSFTVLATPNGSVKQANTKLLSQSLQASSAISVTANLGLVNIPPTQNKFYLLPSTQVVPDSGGVNTVYLSLLNKTFNGNFNNLKWFDEIGNELHSVESVSQINTATGTVNTFKISIPAHVYKQYVQISTDGSDCPMSESNNTNTACSNIALINVAPKGTGVLSIQPNYFIMGNGINYESSQVITISNIGTDTITELALPDLSNTPFHVLPGSNTCTAKLKSGESCKLILDYDTNLVPDGTSGQGSFVINYNNGSSNVNTSATIPYIDPAAPTFPLLNADPVSFSLSEAFPIQVIHITNIGTADATNLLLPTVNFPLIESSTTCSSTLAVGQECNYSVYVNYSGAVAGGSQALTFSYNSNQSLNVAADWASKAPGLLTLSTNNINFSVGNPTQTITLTNLGTGTLYNLTLPNLSSPLIESTVSSCVNGESLAVNQSCDYTLNVDYGAAVAGGNQILTFGYNDSINSVIVKNESATANYESQAGIFAAVAGSANQVDIYSFNTNTGQLVFIESTGLSSSGRGVKFSSDGKYLYVTAVNNIYSFSIDNITGHLTQNGVAAATSGYSNMIITPDGKFGYVANSSYGTGGIMSYNLGVDGSISFNSNAASNLNMIFDVAMSQDGKYMYAAEFFGSPSRLFGYSIESTTGALTQISLINLTAYSGSYDVTISPNESYLFLTTHDGRNSGYIYRAQIAGNGTLSNLSQVNYQSTSYYQNMTFSPNGLYAYVGYSLSPSIAEFAYNSANGGITNLTPSLTPVSPSNNRGVQSAVVFDPTGTFAYAGSYNAPSVINEFKWNSLNGQLESLPISTVGAPDASNISFAIAFSPIP